jgi:hypothetical protein
MNINFIIPIICIAFCVFIFFYFRWYIKKRTSENELLEEYRSEVYRLLAEIDSKTDRDLMLVEDRIKKVNEVLEEADRRIAVYTRELDRSRKGEELYTNLGRGIRAALKTPQVESQRQQQQMQSLIQIVPSPEEKPASPPPPAGDNKNTSKRFIRARIDELASQGLSASEIASRLKISIAEVDLAMNLSRKSNQ